jgi:hypothetical protein
MPPHQPSSSPLLVPPFLSCMTHVHIPSTPFDCRPRFEPLASHGQLSSIAPRGGLDSVGRKADLGREDSWIPSGGLLGPCTPSVPYIPCTYMYSTHTWQATVRLRGGVAASGPVKFMARIPPTPPVTASADPCRPRPPLTTAAPTVSS